ncbi:hypothetical protein [Deinococcus apachensis]|uniref:hypothetical protein n=1 Tax=Deinococcus apachensis TaxID=309886 RepID=UPI003CCBE54C
MAMYVTPWTLPETGVLGDAPLPHWVVTLTPDNPNFLSAWHHEVPATLAHELHHARRWRGRITERRCWRHWSWRAWPSTSRWRNAASRCLTPGFPTT